MCIRDRKKRGEQSRARDIAKARGRDERAADDDDTDGLPAPAAAEVVDVDDAVEVPVADIDAADIKAAEAAEAPAAPQALEVGESDTPVDDLSSPDGAGGKSAAPAGDDSQVEADAPGDDGEPK